MTKYAMEPMSTVRIINIAEIENPHSRGFPLLSAKLLASDLYSSCPSDDGIISAVGAVFSSLVLGESFTRLLVVSYALIASFSFNFVICVWKAEGSRVWYSRSQWTETEGGMKA